MAEMSSGFAVSVETPSDAPLLPMKVMLPEGAMKAAPAVLVTVAVRTVICMSVRVEGAAVTLLAVVVLVGLLPLMLLPQLERRAGASRLRVSAIH